MLFSNILGEPFRFKNRTEEQLMALLKDAGFEVTKSYLTEKKSMMKGMLVLKALPLVKDLTEETPIIEETPVSTTPSA